MRELGTRVEHKDHGAGFAALVISGNIWLLLGMLRANRPWRLVLRLMRVLVAAFAAGAFALVTSDIWRLAEYLGPTRLTVIAFGSVAGIIVTIVVTTGLWERSSQLGYPAGVADQIRLAWLATSITTLGAAMEAMRAYARPHTPISRIPSLPPTPERALAR